MQFHIENMTCGGCARSVTKAIQASHKVEVKSAASRDRLVAALTEVGYAPA